MILFKLTIVVACIIHLTDCDSATTNTTSSTTSSATTSTTSNAITSTTSNALTSTTSNAITSTMSNAITSTTSNAITSTTSNAITSTMSNAITSTTSNAITSTTSNATTSITESTNSLTSNTIKSTSLPLIIDKIITLSTTVATKSKNVSETADAIDLAASPSGRGRIKSRSVLEFTGKFSQCKKGAPEFDKCIREALNNVRSFIPTGVPELKIPSFDPIEAKEVILKRGGPTFGYKLKLKNVHENGWRLSEVTKFRTNLKLNTVQLTQYFPDKYLEGEYEFESLILNPNANKGQFNLSLYELNQTTTLNRPRNSKSIKVNVDVQEIGDMKLHISNLLRGRTLMENILDRMINSAAWRPGFVIFRPFVNELVSTAFTEIYNKVFNDFDFNEILPPS